MMLTALKEPAIAPIAALAFQDVCEDCAEQLSCFSGHLMTACRVSINYSVIFAYSVIIVLTGLSPYRIQCNSSSNRSPYRIQFNCYSNSSLFRVQCNSSSNSFPIGYSVIVALTAFPIGYSLIVTLTALSLGYSVIVALTGLPICYSVIVALTALPVGCSVIIVLTGLPIGYCVIEFIILQEALSNTSLQKRECTRLIAAICSIICTLPSEQLSDHLNTLAGSRVERLEQLARQQVHSDVPHLH